MKNGPWSEGNTKNPTRYVVAIPGDEPTRSARDTLFSCLSGVPKEFNKAGVKLHRIVLANAELFESRVEISGPVRAVGLQYLALQKLWSKVAFDLYTTGVYTPIFTWKMACCLPGIVKIRKFGWLPWVCGSRICPWCHARKLIDIAASVDRASNYELGFFAYSFPSSSCTSFVSESSVKLFESRLRKMKRACLGSYTCSVEMYPSKKMDSWIMRGAVLIPKGSHDRLEEVKWVLPKTKEELLTLFFPYPPQYLTAGSTVLSTLLAGLKNKKQVTRSKR